MARTKGMLNLSGNLEVNAGAPLDARTVVPTVADLTVASNFQYKYVGMTVVVQATGDMYILTANDVTVAANWKQVGSGGGSSYTAGDGIDITNDEISVKAGSNLSFDSSGNLNATDTKYTAGTNVSISNQNVISATDTTYTAGTGIDITNNVISATGGTSYYDSTEKIVGTWFGKYLWQKTIDCGTLPNNSQKNIAHGISNLDFIIPGGIVGSSSNSAGSVQVPLPFFSLDNLSSGINVSANLTNIVIKTGSDRSTFVKTFVTLLYTKTS